MVKNSIRFLTIGALVVVAAAILAATHAQVPSGRPQTGVEWLSWNPRIRRGFVDIYLIGYMQGKTAACEAAAELFVKAGTPIHNLADDPQRRCYRKTESYSRGSDDYVKVLTDFYTAYPQFRKIPLDYLLQTLTDDQYTTAEGIYKKAMKGEVRTDF